MDRETSNLAYREICDSGLVNKLCLKVLYQFANSERPMTAGEIWKLTDLSQRGWVAARIGDLLDMGVLARTPKRKCAVSGRMANTYEFTGALPKKKDEPAELKDCSHCGGTGKVLW